MIKVSCFFLTLFVAVFGTIFQNQAVAAPYTAVLNVSHVAAPLASLDPHKVFGTQAQSFLRQIYGTLVDRDEKGKLIPGIAERWKYLGDNVWRIHIRPDVLFQDGSPLTSRDVKFSFERLLGPKSSRSRRREFSFVKKIEAVSKYVVDIHAKGPAFTLPASLAQFSMILPEKRLREQGDQAFFKAPVGAGPFRFVSTNQKRAILQRHGRYYRGSPAVKELVFHFIKDERERLEMLLNGKLDLLVSPLPAYVRKIASHTCCSIVKKPALQYTYILFDTLSPGPIQDRRVRRALAHWTDVSSLIRFVAHGNARPLAIFVMPEEYGFNPNLKPYKFDPALGKKLMREAGYPNGFSLSVLASDEMAALAKAVARQWKRLGVNLDVKVEPRSKALRLWLRTRDYRANFFAPTNPLVDASYPLRSKLDPRHPVNRFHNSEATKSIQRIDQIKDPEKRKQALLRLQEIVYEEVPAVSFYQRINIYGINSRVRGFRPRPDTILRFYNIR